MGVLDQARDHYRGLCGGRIDVPEWGCAIHYDPPNLSKRARWADMPRSTAMAKVLIDCAMDKDGQPLFADDATSLAALQGEVDATVVTRIANEILGIGAVEAMGNGSGPAET